MQGLHSVVRENILNQKTKRVKCSVSGLGNSGLPSYYF